MPQINWLSIVIAAVIPMLVGFIWYNPKVFGAGWMKAAGVTAGDARKGNMAVIFGVSLVMAFLMSFFILFNVDGPGQEGAFDSFKHGAFHGATMALMLAMPIMVTNALFERKSLRYMLYNIGFWLVSLILIGGILDLMNHFPNEIPVR